MTEKVWREKRIVCEKCRLPLLIAKKIEKATVKKVRSHCPACNTQRTVTLDGN